MSALFALGFGDAGAFQEAVEGLRRSADARPPLFFRNIRGGGGKPLDDQRQPARRHIRPGGVEDQSILLKAGRDQALQVFGGTSLHAGGNFFREQFKQKLGHAHASPWPA